MRPEKTGAKSTLIRILMGVRASSAGTIAMDGEVRDIASPLDAQALGLAAAVTGGASLSGAEGTILGAILGVIMMTPIDNGGAPLGVDPFVLEIAVGALIVLAVPVDKRRRARPRRFNRPRGRRRRGSRPPAPGS